MCSHASHATPRSRVTTHWSIRGLLFALAITLGGTRLAAAEVKNAPPVAAVSFTRDVMPILTKTGCNSGPCHGNQNGKGGFKLSLRGEDAEADYLAITRRDAGRRVAGLRPESSLLLLKPTMQRAHEGGQRFRADSPEYEAIAAWIRDGSSTDRATQPPLTAVEVSPGQRIMFAPERQFRITAIATFADGSRRDVTHLCLFEPSEPIVSIAANGLVEALQPGEATIIVRYLHETRPVRVVIRPARQPFVWQGPRPRNAIDERVFAKLRQCEVQPAATCSDSVFLRRSYLDLLGLLPTGSEARAFVADARSDKRDRLIDTLLHRPEFAEHWAQRWADLLRVEERTLDWKGTQLVHHWLRDTFTGEARVDELARALVLGQGSTYESAPANFYRAMRDPLTRAETVAQLFLGTRLQCARCHNHPFDRWTQDDYYAWGSLFVEIDYKIIENRRRDRNDQHEFDGEQIVFWSSQAECLKHPRSGTAVLPRLLGTARAVSTETPRLVQLADWLTAPSNRWFASVQANRVWFQLMGRGLVEPIDDFRATNPASHPELLDDLAAELVRQRYDVRGLIRKIMRSHTYQLAGSARFESDAEASLFACGSPRRLTSEQLLDGLTSVTGVAVPFNGYPQGTRAGEIPGARAVRDRDQPPTPGDSFLKLFGKPPRLLACECERAPDVTLAQMLQLVSGPLLDGMVSHADNRLTQPLGERKGWPERIDDLYWHTLSRPATELELETATRLVSQAPHPRRGLEDVLWALLNSHEFLLRP